MCEWLKLVISTYMSNLFMIKSGNHRRFINSVSHSSDEQADTISMKAGFRQVVIIQLSISECLRK